MVVLKVYAQVLTFDFFLFQGVCMTKEEFWSEYKKLAHRFPDYYPLQDSMKLRLMFDMVKSFDARWMSKNVARILISNSPIFDWKFAASAEIRARNSVARTNELLNQDIEISDDGLDKALANFGASSLIDCLKIKSQNDTQ